MHTTQPREQIVRAIQAYVSRRYVKRAMDQQLGYGFEVPDSTPMPTVGSEKRLVRLEPRGAPESLGVTAVRACLVCAAVLVAVWVLGR